MHIIEDLARQSDKRWAKVLECWRPRLTKRSVPGWERHMTEEMENCEIRAICFIIYRVDKWTIAPS